MRIHLIEFTQFCENLRLERQLTVAYSLQHNGMTERKNRTAVEMAKCMMIMKNIPLEFFWQKQVILQCIFSIDVVLKLGIEKLHLKLIMEENLESDI